MSDAANGGPWTEGDHEAEVYFDEPLADMIAKLFGPPVCRSVLDIGAGLGKYVEFLAQTFPGPCHGVEPLIARSGENWHVFPEDILEPTVQHLDAEQTLVPWYDLVLCLEVAEHIPREKHTALFDAIDRTSCNWVVFSGATPGQEGLGHVACRSEPEWIWEFTKRGFKQVWILSTLLRRVAYWGWFQQNVMVFERA